MIPLSTIGTFQWQGCIQGPWPVFSRWCHSLYSADILLLLLGSIYQGTGGPKYSQQVLYHVSGLGCENMCCVCTVLSWKLCNWCLYRSPQSHQLVPQGCPLSLCWHRIWDLLVYSYQPRGRGLVSVSGGDNYRAGIHVHSDFYFSDIRGLRN